MGNAAPPRARRGVGRAGGRDLDPPEQAYVAEHGIDGDLERALAGTDAVYVALDVDVLEPGTVSCFMPVPGGLGRSEVESVLIDVAVRSRVAGLGLTGLAEDAEAAALERFAAAAGL